jgi:hypothetical protein
LAIAPQAGQACLSSAATSAIGGWAGSAGPGREPASQDASPLEP